MKMLIYENFILDLLTNGLIENYRGRKESVRNYYNEQYRQKSTTNFHEFCFRMWHLWYIQEFKNKFIYFDKKWLNYLIRQKKEQEKAVQNEKLYNREGCQICLVKFSDENLYKEHSKKLCHNIRLQYLNKVQFPRLQDLKYKLLEVNNMKCKNPSSVKLVLERKSNITATIVVVNTSKSSVEIKEVIHINPYQKEISISPKLKENEILNCGENFNICVKGYFHNSASFTLPIVVVFKHMGSKEENYFLQEIQVDVISEFSCLKSGIPYQKSTKKKIKLIDDEIIPGEMPVMYKSYYREIYPLATYDIPLNLQIKIREVINTYPNFVERNEIRTVGSSFYDCCAALLNINPKLTKENYYHLLDNLICLEENQIKIDIRHYDTKSKLTYIGGNVFQLEVPGLSEARPSLVVHDAVYVKERDEDSRKYQGVVSKVLENSVHLSFHHKFRNIYVKNKMFHIEFGYNRRPIKVQRQALFLAREQNIVSYFYPSEDQVELKQTVENVTYFNSNLNDEQKKAVLNILQEKTVPYLIFGPPGTGKTVTIVESVLQVWKNYPESRIIVCAPSNSATNEIALRLAQVLPATDLFRLIGNTYRQDSNLDQIKNMVNIHNGSFYMPSMETLLRYRVLLTTLVTSARLVNGGIPDGHYSHVFIDESGYATESESLIPIAGILSNCLRVGKVVGQVILAGDPRQLGPVVHSNFVKYCGYGISMLERLIDSCKIYARDETSPTRYNEKFVTKLVKNYRSHEEILKIPNELFYHNELVPASSASSDIFTGWEHLTTPGFPVIFHHIVGEDSRESNSPSFFNIQEIEEVMSYIKKLIGSRVKETEIVQEDIGIITPYKKQAKKLHKACEKQGWNNIFVGSVEQFQGKEKLIVIISTVRSRNTNKFEAIDRKCQLGFIKNPKRFNVALTRAKALLIVIGNGDVLKTDCNWFQFIQHCVQNGSVRGAPFYLSDEGYLQVEQQATNVV